MAAKGKKAKKSNKKDRSGIRRILFGVLTALAVVMLILFLVIRNISSQSPAENALGTLFQPIEGAVVRVTSYLRDVIGGVRDYAAISENYQLVRQENARLQMQIQALEETQLENERLTALLDAQNSYSSQDPIFARVIARDPGVWFDTFTIDRGERDGLEVNMAVMTADGLVGRIEAVGYNYAKVMSIIDPRSSVACLIERTRDNGIMRGEISEDSQDSACNMYYVPAINEIIPSDVVLTSGVDGIYPKGIKIGTVQAITRQSDISDQYIIVTPSVDFLHLEEVLVLRYIVPEEDTGHAPLYQETPRPSPESTLSPNATPEPEATPMDPDEQVYVRPTLGSDGTYSEGGDEDEPEIEATPEPTVDPAKMQPEDVWAM